MGRKRHMAEKIVAKLWQIDVLSFAKTESR